MEPEIITFIGNYGVVGLILYFFIKEFFSYLNKNKVAETLKDSNLDKKKDTDEVARELNSKQDVYLGRIDERLKVIETNHLVHIQKSLENNTVEHTQIQVSLAKICQKLEIK